MSRARAEIEFVRALLQRQLDDFRTLLNERHAAQMRATDAALSSAEKAVSAALAATERAQSELAQATTARFAAANEVRQQLNDQAATFMPRAEYTVQHKALEDRVTALQDTLAARIELNAGNINEVLRELSTYRADEMARRGLRQETRQQANWSSGMAASLVFGLIGALVGVTGIILAILAFLHH